jgi:NADPH:quinone reductase-like Zn-dependent oxidoreductase
MVEKEDTKLTEQHNIRYISQFTRVTTERLDKIAKLVDEGGLKAQVDKVFTLDQAAEALEYLKTSHPRGKVIIRIKD